MFVWNVCITCLTATSDENREFSAAFMNISWLYREHRCILWHDPLINEDLDCINTRAILSPLRKYYDTSSLVRVRFFVGISHDSLFDFSNFSMNKQTDWQLTFVCRRLFAFCIVSCRVLGGIQSLLLIWDKAQFAREIVLRLTDLIVYHCLHFVNKLFCLFRRINEKESSRCELRLARSNDFTPNRYQMRYLRAIKKKKKKKKKMWLFTPIKVHSRKHGKISTVP